MTDREFKFGALEAVHDLNRDYESRHAAWSNSSPNHAHPDARHKIMRFYMNEEQLKERGLIIPTPSWTPYNTLELVHFTIAAQDGTSTVKYEADGQVGIMFREAQAQGCLAGKGFIAFKLNLAEFDDITGLGGVPKVAAFQLREVPGN